MYKMEQSVFPSNAYTLPAARTSRIHALDALRGFALFGILLVNIAGFAYPMLAEVPNATGLDQAMRWLVSLVGEVKFFVLFSFLFGYGLSVQMERARAKNLDLKGRYRRRLVGIFCFGILHAVFLFYGDILVCYAILGALLWWIRDWGPRRLVYFGVGMLIVATGAFALIGWAVRGSTPTPEELSLIEAAREAYAGSSWLASVFQRLIDWAIITPFLLLYNWPAAMAMFALGLAAGKIQLMQRLDTYWPTLVRLLPWVAGVAILGNVLYASASLLGDVAGPSYPWVQALATAQVAISGPALTYCFCMILLWAARTNRLIHLRTILRAAGRLSLTNYLGQSLICGLIFNGVGLGFYEQISPTGLVGLTVLIFLGQALLSLWWMRHFRYGPLEWILRAWTYKAWPILLRSRKSLAQAHAQPE